MQWSLCYFLIALRCRQTRQWVGGNALWALGTCRHSLRNVPAFAKNGGNFELNGKTPCFSWRRTREPGNLKWQWWKKNSCSLNFSFVSAEYLSSWVRGVCRHDVQWTSSHTCTKLVRITTKPDFNFPLKRTFLWRVLQTTTTKKNKKKHLLSRQVMLDCS